MNVLIPTNKFPRGPGSLQLSDPLFCLTHTLSLLLEIQVAQGYLEAQCPDVHLSMSSTPNTCVKRSLSRMRP